MAESSEPAARIAAALSRLRLGRRMGEGASDPGAFPHGWHGGPHGAHHHGHGFPGGPLGDAGPAGEGPFRGRGGPRGAFGRSMARIRLLEMLATANRPMSVGQIAELLGVDQPRATRLVQAVVETGHARREADPDDARRTLVVLTDDGRAFAARARGARSELVEQALAGFTPEESAQLADLLSRLADAWPRPER